MMSTILSGPHYELPSAELADWIETQGLDCWWNVDGDPRLTSLVTFPCPGDELVAELRRLNRPLLVQVDQADAKGEPIDAGRIDGVVSRLRKAFTLRPDAPEPPWANDRFLYLCWKGSPVEWMLVEDSVATQDSLKDYAELVSGSDQGA